MDSWAWLAAVHGIARVGHDWAQAYTKEGIAARNLVSNSDSVFYLILYSQSSCIPEPRREPQDSYNTLTSSWKTGFSPQRSWRGKKCCFLNFYCWFEGLPLLISWTVQSVSPKGRDGNKRGSITWAFQVHKSFCECKQLGVYTGGFSEQGMLILSWLTLIYNLREPNTFCPM